MAQHATDRNGESRGREHHPQKEELDEQQEEDVEDRKQPDKAASPQDGMALWSQGLSDRCCMRLWTSLLCWKPPTITSG